MRIVKEKRDIEVKLSSFMSKSEKIILDKNLKRFRKANPHSSKSALLRHLFLEILSDREKTESFGFKF